MIRPILRKIQPGWLRALRRSLDNYKILSTSMGQFQTMRRETCTNREGDPIPWLTYSAIEFLNQLDFSVCSVFEFGSGASTLYWAKRARSVVSVEDSPEWHHRMKDQMPAGVRYLLAQSHDEFVGAIDSFSAEFDVIVIDSRRYRYDCAVAARRKLHRNGFIIVDNADWVPKTCQFLRESNLIQVDMWGFGPVNGYTWATSFFFSREVKLIPRHDRQPVAGAGSTPAPASSIE